MTDPTKPTEDDALAAKAALFHTDREAWKQLPVLIQDRAQMAADIADARRRNNDRTEGDSR